jgi:NADH-quinone oxidoreductase subunit B
MGLVERGKLPKPLTHLLNLSRSYSLWVYQWGLACCAIEMGAAFGSPRYDVMRLGVIPFPASPRQADLVVISGTVTDKLAPRCAACTSRCPTRSTSSAWAAAPTAAVPYWDSTRDQGRRPADPVDVYVPGCPPRPEALLEGIVLLQQRIKQEDMSERWRGEPLSSSDASSSDAGTGDAPDPRGHEGAPEVPIDAPVESAPADRARARGRRARTDAAPGAPAELDSDDGPARPVARRRGRWWWRRAEVTTTSGAAADDVPVVEEVVPTPGRPGPRGRRHAAEAPAPSPGGPTEVPSARSQEPEKVPAVRITTSPTGETVPVSAGKMTATTARRRCHHAGPAASTDQASDATVTVAALDVAAPGTTAAGEQIPEGPRPGRRPPRSAVAGDPVPGSTRRRSGRATRR